MVPDLTLQDRQNTEDKKTDLETRVRQSQERQKTGHDQHARHRTFKVGDTVYVLNHRGSPKWNSAVVAKLSGPLSLVVKFPDGREARYHVDHVRAQATEATLEDDEEMGDVFNPSSGEAKDNNKPLPTIPI